ncbi:hypothetical protein LY78DRAFT_668894 [Colletotrichum sublineola]|nr:hypothetical protein LY78DRAFT_668894 [Colletotrichum sublineola]
MPGFSQQCTVIPTLMQLEWAENRLAEFKLWAASIGALAGGAASLDARLTTESNTKNLVKGLLLLLSECLGKCKRFGSDSRSMTDEASPLEEAKANVEQIINHLTRVALATRKSGTIGERFLDIFGGKRYHGYSD